MNLYRSFGNLMEAWVSEGGHGLDPEWLGINDEDSPTSNLRSESVDSGVETASSDMSFPATSPAEMDASASQSPALSSPVLSSSSLHLHPSRPQRDSNALHQKLEETLRRTEVKSLKEDSQIPTVVEVLRRRPKRHTSDVLRAHRSESFGLRGVVSQSGPTRQMSETCRRPVSMICEKQQVQARSEVRGDDKRKELSPGLCYLEQVCQMLEEIARQQMHNQALQMEMDALWEHQDMEESQALDTCQSDCKAAEDDLTCSQRRRNTNSLECKRKEYPYGHFRKRSASDPTVALMHIRMMKADCRGQHMSTDGPQEEEEVHKKQESNSLKNWKLKIGSLRRNESALRDMRGQQMQPSERNSARRRLSQLFRRSRKTLPA